MRNSRLIFSLIGLSFLISPLTKSYGETKLQIIPEVFDFGWAPDNAILKCEVHIRNIGGEMVALTAVLPSCGCTATDFTPDAIPASEEKKISLTFNTRGYTGMPFDKPIQVKAGMPEEEFSVHVKGHVTNSNAVVFPEGTGVVTFGDGSSKSNLIVHNKSDQPMTLSIVHESDDWADVSLPKKGLPASGQASIEIRVDGSLSENRQTSTTVEATDGTQTHRFTLAIVTGQVPQPVRRIRTAPKGSPTSPSPEKQSAPKKS
jgi:hypothetical protein